MRNYLQEVEIVGAVLCFQEGEQCHWSIDWLVANCNRVLIMLDNWDDETEKIVLEYKRQYPDIVRVAYTKEPVNPHKNTIPGQIKKRFKNRQNYIREEVIQELHRMHKEKPIDMVIWMDSDETWINEFPKYLEEFWYNRLERWMMVGFVEPFNDFKTLIYQKMSPHGRVFKYDPTMTAQPYAPRTRYYPFIKERSYKIRNLVVHLNHLTEAYRARRQHFDNTPFVEESLNYPVWRLPKDVREMTVEEIAEYQPGAHGAPSLRLPTILQEYIQNNKLN